MGQLAILRHDADGREQTIVATLSATAWTPLATRLAVPDWATRAMIATPAGIMRYRLNGDPGGLPDGTASAGVTLPANETWIVGLAPGLSRTLGLSSITPSAAIRVVWLP